MTNFGDGTVSSYAVAGDGSVALSKAVRPRRAKARRACVTKAISRDGRYLYAIDADARKV